MLYAIPRVAIIGSGVAILASCMTVSEPRAVSHGTSGTTLVSQQCAVPRLWGEKAMPKSDRDARFALNPCDPETRTEELAVLTRAEMADAGSCLAKELQEKWGQSRHPLVDQYPAWQAYGDSIFGGVAQGGCYMQIYVNPQGAAYGQYEKSGPLPDGTKIVKTTFAASPDGKLLIGPFIAMEKIAGAQDTQQTGGWRFTHLLADGSVKDTRTPEGAAYVSKCISCHRKALAGDYIYYPPERVRVLFSVTEQEASEPETIINQNNTNKTK